MNYQIKVKNIIPDHIEKYIIKNIKKKPPEFHQLNQLI